MNKKKSENFIVYCFMSNFSQIKKENSCMNMYELYEYIKRMSVNISSAATLQWWYFSNTVMYEWVDYVMHEIDSMLESGEEKTK